MTTSPGLGESNDAGMDQNPHLAAHILAGSDYADPADTCAVGAGLMGHRLHKPGVAGSSPAAATYLSSETIDAYHSDAEWWSKSQLWDLMSQGPQFFCARHLARTLQPYARDASLKKGTHVHEWAEQGDDAWWARVVIIPDDALGTSGRRTKKTEAFVSTQAADAILLKQSEADEYRRQFEAIKANPIFGQLSQQTTSREVSIRWIDPGTGLQLKCRPDALTPDVVWDIKTTSDPNPLPTFYKSVLKWGYDIQAVHYLDGVAASGSDVLGIPHLDIEVKARAGLPISETMAQLKRRRRETGLGVGVLRMNGQGEKAIGDWVAILTFDDLIYLLKAAGYR